MFRGRYEHALDAKGRTSLPSRFRDVLPTFRSAAESACEEALGRLVLTTGLERCVVAYPLSEWLAFEQRLAKLPQFDPHIAMLRRIYVSSAVECDLDKLGRLLIPTTLRQHAGLKKDAVWAGMGKYVELWAKERFDAICDEVMDSQQERTQMAARLAELGL